ncbi:DUF1801 domain-containing protein [Mucilaginibacter sp. RS28]|uniref:DUF1801 domain-containing protein n=1 Tax=Mucilaginibacter straminoryzae TaxID=2932774 RepID=A0A9X2B8X5_9SPHI|nr:DUF1801 domain-containing protein [Mucilaginibacter straminoryzae]MCJ8210044.1 DUF1801 domain-containing protein [Mucilaginibacter straminoryzae]
MDKNLTYTTIDEYIDQYPEEIQKLLQQVRATIKQAAPEAEEAISYQIPTFKLKGNLVHFAAFKNHIGLYPGASGVKQFEGQLKDYELSKGTIRFPINKPLPLDLVTDIVKYRVQQNLEKAALKKVSKKVSKKA